MRSFLPERCRRWWGREAAGKSTLLRAALGLIPRDCSHVLVEGRPLRTAMERVAYVLQRDAVDWDFPITVREVVELGRFRATGQFRRLPRSDSAPVDDCLDRVGMSGCARQQIRALSGGQRQRLFLARALAQQAPVLVMDEPFAGADARTEVAMLELLADLRTQGRSVIVVHHDLETVRSAFDCSLVLNVRAVACGPVADVLAPGTLRHAPCAGGTADGEEWRAPWIG